MEFCVHCLLLHSLPFRVMIPQKSHPEGINLEQQIIDVLDQYLTKNNGYHVNEKALEQIRANA